MDYRKIFTKRGRKVLYNIPKYIVVFLINKLSIFGRNKKEEIWLIAERSNEARDNGFHMFKYIRENHPKIKAYYAIEKNSVDREKLIKFDNIIEFGSFKHYDIYFKASKHISTHINGYMPNEKVCLYFNKFLKVNAKKVFLQHGIIKDFMPQCCKENTGLDLFVCGAHPEYLFVKENFGYTDEVQYLGLPRYDLLKDYKLKRQVLLMPTFRMNLFMYSEDKISEDKELFFLKSDYYNRYQSLINNKKLSEILEKDNIELVFYPHYEIQRYLNLFSTLSKNIRIADKDKFDVQQLLKESALLITDYSSVFFDFAYMKKPVIYYQFDYEEYRKIHYKEGYFSYNTDGFGKVVYEEDELVEELIRILKNGLTMDECYIRNSNKFFKLNDSENRLRVFNAIKNLK